MLQGWTTTQMLSRVLHLLPTLFVLHLGSCFAARIPFFYHIELPLKFPTVSNALHACWQTIHNNAVALVEPVCRMITTTRRTLGATPEQNI